MFFAITSDHDTASQNESTSKDYRRTSRHLFRTGTGVRTMPSKIISPVLQQAATKLDSGETEEHAFSETRAIMAFRKQISCASAARTIMLFC